MNRFALAGAALLAAGLLITWIVSERPAPSSDERSASRPTSDAAPPAGAPAEASETGTARASDVGPRGSDGASAEASAPADGAADSAPDARPGRVIRTLDAPPLRTLPPAVQAEIERLRDRSVEGLQVQQRPDGSSTVNLEGRFQTVIAAQKDEDGNLVITEY